MARERGRQFGIIVSTCLVVLLGFTSIGEARSLTRALVEGFTFDSVPGRPFLSGRVAEAFAPSLGSAIAQAVTQQVPLASVSPTFSYRYNETLRLYEPSSTVSGPLFSERALTLGGGRLNLGVAYSYIDFDDLNGNSLNNLQGSSFLTSINPGRAIPVPSFPGLLPGETAFIAPIEFVELRTRLKLQAHIVTTALRYGISDVWDVSPTMPIIHNKLKVTNDAVFRLETDPQQAGLGFTLLNGRINRQLGFVNANGERVPQEAAELIQSTSAQSRFRLGKESENAAGIGDITLRTKYQVWQTDQGGVALGLNLLLPTGDEDDFLGTGETHVTPQLYASQVLWNRFEPYLNVGLDFNADDVDRSSFVFATGATLQVIDRLALLVNFIGRQEFGRLSIDQGLDDPTAGGVALVDDRDPATCTVGNPCFPDVERGAQPFFPGARDIKTNFFADVSFGIRYVLSDSGSVFFGAIIPLNDDGFRADFIPSGGIEYTF